MPRFRRADERKPPNEQMQYPGWKADAAQQLRQRHHIDATSIAERIWTQFYARGLDPNEAAHD
jgi:hypothetical protein